MHVVAKVLIRAICARLNLAFPAQNLPLNELTIWTNSDFFVQCADAYTIHVSYKIDIFVAMVNNFMALNSIPTSLVLKKSKKCLEIWTKCLGMYLKVGEGNKIMGPKLILKSAKLSWAPSKVQQCDILQRRSKDIFRYLVA